MGISGVALLMCVFLALAPVLWLPRWFAEQRRLPSIANGGRPWQRRQHGRPPGGFPMRFFTRLRGRARFRIRRLGWLDRQLIGLRLARGAGLGIPAFDQRWLLECHADACVDLIDAAMVKRLIDLDDALGREGHLLRSLEMRDDEVSIWVDLIKGGPGLPASSVLGLARPLIDAIETSVARRQYLAGIHAGSGSAWPLWLLPPLWAWSVFGLWRIHSGPDLLHELDALKASAGFAVMAAALFVATCVLALRGSRRGAEVVGRALVLGVPLVVLASHLTYREANIRLDRGPPASIAVHRAPVDVRMELKRTSQWIHLADAGDGRGAQVRIRPGLGSSLGVRSQFDNEASGTVEVMPGAFGHPWVSWFSGVDRESPG